MPSPYHYDTNNPVTWNGQQIPQISGSDYAYSPTNQDIWDYRANLRRANQANNPSLPPTPSLVSFNGTAGNPADWWKRQVFKGGGEGEILASAANALIPVFASDEQKSIASWLGENFKGFESYKNIDSTPSSPQALSATRSELFSKGRAEDALANLDAMRRAAGMQESNMGPGYKFLKDTIALLTKYGTNGVDGMSRATFAEMQKEFDKISAGIDSSYVELGRAFLNPTSGGQSVIQSIKSNGRDSFGIPNTRLFT